MPQVGIKWVGDTNQKKGEAPSVWGGGSKNEIKTRGDRGSKLVGGLGPPNVVVVWHVVVVRKNMPG